MISASDPKQPVTDQRETTMYRPRISVNFNEMVRSNLVLLSKTDEVTDSSGAQVGLSDGLPVYVYEYSDYGDGEEELLVADGVAEPNDPATNGEWTAAAKWCCRIDERGIRALRSSPRR